MKRLLFLVILLLAGCFLFGCSNDAKQYEKYIISDNDNGITIVGYKGIESKIIIPESINGKKVTEISENAFNGFMNLKEIYIPDSVTKIDSAFFNCNSLVYAYIGTGVQEMRNAFSSCTSLVTVDGYNNAVYMNHAFDGCSSLLKAHIPASVLECDYAFKDCVSLKDVSVLAGASSLNYTFVGCSSLQSIEIPSSINTLDHTFVNCSSLENISGLSSITTYRNSFENCKKIVSIDLGDNVVELQGAFLGCSALKQVHNLPDEIEKYSASFGGCSMIEYITIPHIIDEEFVNSYNISGDFYGCSSLKVVIINNDFDVNDSVSSVFSDCANLEMIKMPETMLCKMSEYNYIYKDELYVGNNLSVLNVLVKMKAQQSYATIPNYTVIDDRSYMRVIGGEINSIDADDIADNISDEDFKPFSEYTYYIAIAEDDSESQMKTVYRLYSFYRSSSRNEECKLPSQIYINGDLFLIK